MSAVSTTFPLGLSELPFPEYATSRGVDSEVDVDVDSGGDDGGDDGGEENGARSGHRRRLEQRW